MDSFHEVAFVNVEQAGDARCPACPKWGEEPAVCLWQSRRKPHGMVGEHGDEDLYSSPIIALRLLNHLLHNLENCGVNRNSLNATIRLKLVCSNRTGKIPMPLLWQEGCCPTGISSPIIATRAQANLFPQNRKNPGAAFAAGGHDARQGFLPQ